MMRKFKESWGSNAEGIMAQNMESRILKLRFDGAVGNL